MLEDFIHCVDFNTGIFANPISPSDITNMFGHALFRGSIVPLNANIATTIRQECLARGFR